MKTKEATRNSAPSKKSELEILRAVLGRGPADLLMFIAMVTNDDGDAVQIRMRHIRGCGGMPRSKSTIRKYRNELEEAGLLRVGMCRDNREGYFYQLRGTESLSLKQCVDEWLAEDGTEVLQ